ncbi:proton-associated sugar transporter A [Chrysoperla carnea]|uniref:proton-associated sugar transporter A n=1 Tax=Chrysoperla carnea TaxID=189513 RepID=UPI001D0815CB|nr:proton-associated sugar transporter A [Chrysoperla carnea]
MVDKLHEYQGCIGQFHTIRDRIRNRWCEWKEAHPQGVAATIRGYLDPSRPGSTPPPSNQDDTNAIESEDYSHVYRRKTRKELIRVSAAVMGIEFSYAAETAFVSPTLLKIGVSHQHMTLVWALSPLVGFFCTPILGSLSDRCRLLLGRRRPFIILLSIGVFLGLILVPNGEDLGYAMGDSYPKYFNFTQPKKVLPHRTSAYSSESISETVLSENTTDIVPHNPHYENSHPWGVFFTILGTVLLDFDADACQSPSRAYLLDVCIPEDHAKGLSTFTIMAGLGGFMGYALGGINWDVTFIGALFGGHVRAVFTLITIIFVGCVSYTVTSFNEIPLPLLEKEQRIHLKLTRKKSSLSSIETDRIIASTSDLKYGTNEEVKTPGENENDVEINVDNPSILPQSEEVASLREYLQSIVYMPWSLRMLCLTNLFCWMAHVCYSLYFTDFVGEAVFGGDPKAMEGTVSHELYEQGVRFGCWGMSMYSLSCACYSFVIEKLIKRFRAKPVYIGGLLVYSSGMCLMALTKHKIGVILFSWSAGVMYSTLFTMPYLLIAHYHAYGTFEIDENGQASMGSQVRGLGTDIAVVSSMVFLAQFILSMCMGTIVALSGTTTAVVVVACTLSLFGALAATQVMYLDL